ncbi:MAG: alkaline phosphatase family protein, partial [Bacteroidota bacterium]
MQRLFTAVVTLIFSASLQAQTLQRPKLVVGIVVDQMRWDYLYRFYDRYDAKGGFKRMLSQGFSCENTMIPYTPTVTACGHSSIYTGSVAAV